MEIMDVIEKMNQRHSGTVRAFVATLGGDVIPIIKKWTDEIGKTDPLAGMFGVEPTFTVNDAADAAYWDIVKYAQDLYFKDMTRETATAVANAITYCGVLKLADDLEFTDTGFADAWSDAHPDQPRISRVIDIG